MTTVAIIGAGPGLGLATARRFGREGHDIALIARTPSTSTTSPRSWRRRVSTPRGLPPTSATRIPCRPLWTPPPPCSARSRSCSTARSPTATS